MIVCKYNELKNYQCMLPHLTDAMACVEKLRKDGIATGRYEFEGGFLFVQTGETKPLEEDKFETHRKYLDIQYIISGEEEMAYLSLQDLVPAVQYSDENDIQFYRSNGAAPSVIRVPEGTCYVVFQEDGHMPCRCTTGAKFYTKMVIKLPLV